MRSLALAALLLAACSSPGADANQPPISPTSATVSSPPSSPAGAVAQVVRVLDDDSLVVKIDSAEAEVRLIGVNAPEGSECYGDAARSKLERLLAAGDPTLVADGEDTDQYGRLLRYLFVGGTNVNISLLTGGDALVLQGDYRAEG